MGWFRKLFAWLLPTVLHSFKCVVCLIVSVLTDAAAKELGWRWLSASPGAPAGWRCPSCCAAQASRASDGARPA